MLGEHAYPYMGAGAGGPATTDGAAAEIANRPARMVARRVPSMPMTLPSDQVDSKEALASFVRGLCHGFEDSVGSWENDDLGAFLETLAAWIDDADAGTGTLVKIPLPAATGPSSPKP
ncbi:hypothetical protein OIU91_16095 [Streptomyces sp. NBC_01456]|uniref:DUF7660 family protein n=1 Tax=unclassified Streptomyces TaxID=2593676 RepID=UPI002E33C2C9|nr:MULTISPECIES: hypothetical protein [unclassified Streptomyces]